MLILDMAVEKVSCEIELKLSTIYKELLRNTVTRNEIPRSFRNKKQKFQKSPARTRWKLDK